MGMKIDELDVVKLKDGRVGTVIDVQKDEKGPAYLIEIPDEDFFDAPYVRKEDVETVTWRYAEHPWQQKTEH